MVSDLRRACIHESGHAVVALRLGAKVLKLRLLVAAGMTPGGGCTWIPCDGKSDRMTVAVAGHVAERILQLKTDHRCDDWALSSQDERDVRSLLPYGFRDLDEVGDFLDVQAGRIKAAKILEEQWDEVSAVAAALLDKIELSGDEVAEIVACARTERLCRQIQEAKAEYPLPTAGVDRRDAARNPRDGYLTVIDGKTVWRPNPRGWCAGRVHRLVLPPAC